MADNYLEKRMDDYARGRLGANCGKARGHSGVKFPHQQVLIVDCDALPCGVAILRILVEAGHTVCLTAADRKGGTRISQTYGGRFYPIAFDAIAEDVARRGESFDTIVLIDPEDINKAIDATAQLSPRQWLVVSEKDVVLPEGRPCVALIGHQPEAAAVLALALTHPAVNAGGIVTP